MYVGECLHTPFSFSSNGEEKDPFLRVKNDQFSAFGFGQSYEIEQNAKKTLKNA